MNHALRGQFSDSKYSMQIIYWHKYVSWDNKYTTLVNGISIIVSSLQFEQCPSECYGKLFVSYVEYGYPFPGGYD